jgi:hypothetical protein
LSGDREAEWTNRPIRDLGYESYSYCRNSDSERFGDRDRMLVLVGLRMLLYQSVSMGCPCAEGRVRW